jgi:hypothetical protein
MAEACRAKVCPFGTSSSVTVCGLSTADRPACPAPSGDGPRYRVKQGLEHEPNEMLSARSRPTPDFWTAVGGSYKLSFHYIVTVPIPSGAVLHRGPPAHEQRLSVGDRLARRPGLEERSRVAGKVVEDGGTAVADAWVTLRDLGRVCETDSLGHFSFTGVPPGSHAVLVRDRSGREVEARLEVPGVMLVVAMPAVPG